jgi:hypothetical protein
MQFIIELLFLIFISLIFVAIDLNNYSGKCIINLDKQKKIQAFTIIISHHLLATLGNFGWLFSSKIILILFCVTIISIIIHWLLNGNKCLATQKLNQLCDFPDTHYFPDFFYIIGLKKYDFWNNWGGSYVFYLVILLIGIYKLFTF